MSVSYRSLYLLIIVVVPLLGIIIFTGCGDDRNVIRDQRVVTSPAGAPSAASQMSTGERFGFRQTIDTTASDQQPYIWDAPASWVMMPSAPLRPANFVAGEDGSIEIYLSVLGGTGGGIPANVNRWRNQLSLSDLEDHEIITLPKIQMLGQDAVLIDFEGQFSGMAENVSVENARMLGAMLLDEDNAVFVKLVGPSTEVATEYENFLEFVHSIERNTSGHVHHAGIQGDWQHPPINGDDWVHPPIPDGMQDMSQMAFQSERPEGLQFTAPETWQRGADRPVRLVTFNSGPDNEVETYVTILPGAAGGLLLNVNRWREEMGHPRLSQSDLDNLPELDILNTKAKLVEVAGNYAGKTGDQLQNAKMLGIIVPLESQVLFARMTGPAEVLNAERDNFIDFCSSFRFSDS